MRPDAAARHPPATDAAPPRTPPARIPRPDPSRRSVGSGRRRRGPTRRGTLRRPRAGRWAWWAWSFAAERAHLERAVSGDRVRGRELDRLPAIGAADDLDAGDERLAVGKRPVGEQRLPIADTDRRRCLRALQRAPQDVEAARS